VDRPESGTEGSCLLEAELDERLGVVVEEAEAVGWKFRDGFQGLGEKDVAVGCQHVGSGVV
jgi:hypothetical protein